MLNDYRVLLRRPGFLVRRLHQIHLALFDEECSKFSITPVQFTLMSVLMQRPGIEQLDLANEIGVDRTTIGDVIARMERRGLIVRNSNPADRRAKLVRLTPKGRKLCSKMEGAVQRTHDRTLEALPESDRVGFLSALARLVEAKNHVGRAGLRLQ